MINKYVQAVVLSIIVLVGWALPVAAHGETDDPAFAVPGRMVLTIAVGLALLTVFVISRSTTKRFHLNQYGIMALGITTAVIHLLEGTAEFILILNGLGYLTLLGALYLPLGIFANYRKSLNWGLLAYTLLTIVMFFVIHPWGLAGGQLDQLGLVTKAVELMLVVLLSIEIVRKENTLALASQPQSR